MSTASHTTPIMRRDLRWYYVSVLVIAAIVHLTALWNAAPLRSANDRSRWSTVWSLAEKGTFIIDERQDDRWQTIDKVRFNGHFYSSKPALFPAIVAGFYKVLHQITGWSILDDTEIVCRSLLTLVNFMPWMVALGLVCMMTESFARTTFARLIIPPMFAFGTYLSPFSVAFNNHLPAAITIVLSLYPFLRIICEGRRSPWYFAMCGFFAGATITNELPSASWAATAFIILLQFDWKRTLFFGLPAALLPIIAFLAANYIQTGGIYPFYAYYDTELYRYAVDGVPSYWMNPRGIDQNLDSPPVYLMHCLIGHHGIFSLTPFFLLTLAAWFRLRRDAGHPLWIVTVLSATLTVIVMAFYMTRTGNYNYGGNTAALRWALWLVPFWIFATIPMLDALYDRIWMRVVATLLVIVSVISAFSVIDSPWQSSWAYRWMDSAGWIDYSSKPEPLDRTYTTWFSNLPISSEGGEWVEFEYSDAENQSMTLRMESLRTDEESPNNLRLRFTRTKQGEAEPMNSFDMEIDTAKFQAGNTPEEFLVAPESGQARLQALNSLRMLPTTAALKPSFERYLKTPLRTDAFTSKQAAVRVRAKDESGSNQIHRLDTYFQADVPFGCVRFIITVTDADTGMRISKTVYDIVDCSPPPPPHAVFEY
ncbi:hypothetical protein [Calycomorphotria hydatis]|nr:hypothetical protein [Calycomorphotria hydatis]